MVFPFFSLPFELRARIIHHALLQCHAKPSCPEPIENRTLVADYQPCSPRLARGVFYQQVPEFLPSNNLALLLASRQLNAETRTQLALSRAYNSYDLDVMLNSDRQLLPTWVCVPQVCDRVENLNVSFRLFGPTPKPRKHQKKDVWRMFRWRAAYLCGFILDILTRFVALGACPPRSKDLKRVDRQTRIQRLNINVERTQDTCKSCPMWADCPHLWELEAKTSHDWNLNGPTEPFCVLHPELFIYWLIIHMKSILRMPHPNEHGTGRLLYDNIGCITFSLEGTVVETLDLGHALVSLARHNVPLVWAWNHRPTSRDCFAKSMLERRVDNGFGKPRDCYENEFFNHCEFDLFDFRR